MTQLYGHPLSIGTNIDPHRHFVWIPKNASSGLRDNYNERTTFPKKGITNATVFLRHPYFRWKSGVMQYLFRQIRDLENITEKDLNYNSQLILDLIRDNKLIFDEHTSPQMDFLTWEPHDDNCIGSDEIENWEYYLIDRGDDVSRFESVYSYAFPNGIGFLNVTSTNRIKMKFQMDLDTVISKHTINNIREIYHDDFSLYFSLY
ncbi:hypothetical protein EB151_03510 [archaeon]|nr:hypothetical protein [archaeon]